jgi:hypothetical protein
LIFNISPTVTPFASVKPTALVRKRKTGGSMRQRRDTQAFTCAREWGLRGALIPQATPPHPASPPAHPCA